MANEWTLWAAIVAIVEEDTGASGLVGIFGKPHPLVLWGDSGMNSKPILVASMGVRSTVSATDRQWVIPITFNAIGGAASNELLLRGLDRLELILTANNLAAKGVDAAPFVRRRRSLPELTMGGQREASEIDFRLKR